jgi:predicted short-subunit dehydrogenase-like oxidoreductase (DUF2520 family)
MDAPHRPRLKVGVVSAGRVGSVVGAALRSAGHQVTGVAAVSDISRLRAEALLPGVPIEAADHVVAGCELLILSVPDDVLPGLVQGFAQAGVFQPGQFIAHTSGGFGVSVLAPATEALPMAIHPVMTFTGTSIDLSRLHDTPFGVTAAEEIRPVAEALVVEMGGDPIWVPEDARAVYHAAMVIGSNYLNVLVNESVSLLKDAGMENPSRLLAPLLSASLDNALRFGDKALTGPIVRGDAVTVGKHLDALSDRPHTRSAYQVLGRLAVDRALEAGMITVDQAANLLVELGEKL